MLLAGLGQKFHLHFIIIWGHIQIVTVRILEALFLFPVMMNFKEIMAGHTARPPSVVVIDLIIFIAILVSGLAYAWKKGILKWE